MDCNQITEAASTDVEQSVYIHAKASVNSLSKLHLPYLSISLPASNIELSLGRSAKWTEPMLRK